MSIQFPQQQAPRRKSGGSLLFLILLGVGAFIFMSNMGPAGGNGAGQGQQRIPDRSIDPIEDDYARQREAVFGPDEPKSKIGQKMPSTGGTGAASGWGMDDVVTKQNPVQPATTPARQPSPSKTENGDWAMEEFEGKKPVERQLQFSTPTNQPVLAPENNWSIDNVKPKPKTQNGDWSIE